MFLNNALKEGKLDIVANAYLYYIVKVVDGTEAVLIKVLNAYGNENMAEDYLNCGNSILCEAAREWAINHGYEVYEVPGYFYYHAWGSGKN